jgi:hypothetical protein
VRYLIDPKSYKDQIFNRENEDIDEVDKYNGSGFHEFMKSNSAVTSDKFNENVKFSPVVKDMVYNMVLSSLRSKEQHGLFYNKMFAKDLPEDLIMEIEATSMSLDKEILNCVTSALLPYNNIATKEDQDFMQEIMNNLISDNDFKNPDFCYKFYDLCRYYSEQHEEYKSCIDLSQYGLIEKDKQAP